LNILLNKVSKDNCLSSLETLHSKIETMSSPKKMRIKKKPTAKSQTNESSPPNGSVMTPSQDTKASKTIQTKLAKSRELERQLANIPVSSRTTEFEAKASQIRLELCENLSDILLCDPTFATQYDVAAKLWRGCFYDRIVELRGRISRASRSKNTDKEEKKKILMGLEKTLQQFLSEAIKLYVYLIGKYEGMMLPPSTQSQSQLSYQSQESRSHHDRSLNKRNKKSSNGALLLSPPSDGEDDSTHFVVPQGVIPTLYRILIHQGDLYRYDGDFTMAESSYSKASKLAPGKGNPYNQLAGKTYIIMGQIVYNRLQSTGVFCLIVSKFLSLLRV
jgi:molecular chaperone GrpE (heat shock protein)